MILRWMFSAAVLGAAILEGCGSSPGVSRGAAPSSRDELYAQGHAYFTENNLDSAVVVLNRAVMTDSSYIPALSDLADVQYELAMKVADEKNPARVRHMRAAQSCLVRMETLGSTESSVYERLCSISAAIDDNRAFLKYARKNAERYPYDRQVYNLGLAYYQSGDYAAAVRTTREAIEKFRVSSYVGGFYRVLGLSYMKMERDQTATRTFETGIQTADKKIASLKDGETGQDSGESRRLSEDRIGMLMSLRKLYTTYRDQQNLERVERLLKAAGRLQ